MNTPERKDDDKSRDYVDKFLKEWRSARQEKTFVKSQAYAVSNLFNHITEAISEASKNSASAKAATLDTVRKFLDSEKDEIDDCILWLLLYTAASDDYSKPDLAESDFIIMMAQKHPNLSFETPDGNFSRPQFKSIKDRCNLSNGHSKIKKSRQTPFHHAAQECNAAVIKIMRIALLDSECDRALAYKIVKEKDSRANKTALQHAIDSGQKGIDTLREILDFPCMTNFALLNEAFESAVRNGQEEAVNVLLRKEDLTQQLMVGNHILVAMDHCRKSDGNQSYMAIIKKLVQLMKISETTNGEVIDSIIELQSIKQDQRQVQALEADEDWMSIWKAVPADVIQETFSLIHLAVYHRSVSFITEFLKDEKYSKWAITEQALPKSTKRNGDAVNDKHYPLWYIGKEWNGSALGDREPDEISKRIRAILVSWIVRQTREMKTLSKIFHESGLDTIFWNPAQTQTLVNLNEIAHMVSPVLSEFLKDLERHISNIDPKVIKNFQPTKVAIIDNGVLSITHTSAAQETSTTPLNGGQTGQNMASKSLSSRIKGGRSFVDDGSKLSSWLFASDPHGTQMANLICSMDPFCDLYVARVAERTHGITSARAARALKWALDQDVDIISMSISMLEKDEDLKNQVLQAKKNKVVIVCSTHDEGSSITTSYPAEWMGDEVIVVTACDEYGRTLRETNENKFDFMLRGKNVAAGVIPFIASSERISGSSVSTALTAGLSSLILTCHKLAVLGKTSNNEDHRNKTPADKVRDHINNNMISKTPGSREILLEKFSGTNALTPEGSMENILVNSFSMKD
ncbi:hypothetical protein TGAM01_v200191 [Trichoderma gamsii]|uniref:Peptidase S8/S53 domain-containing protein n=1 Tax=Trichoderma gamsii TaxID=398673 RepID=A0A2P5A2L6_9HYPO|nr:hypothetical protein TGAM01_v200191 [Trichoderma gamsii]PON30771.1 hypothetical protein TGAM01_v200191 [Trichoderma gamsii]